MFDTDNQNRKKTEKIDANSFYICQTHLHVCSRFTLGNPKKKRAGCGLAMMALKEPVVMCGLWNVRQATSQQVFKVTTLCTDTCFQSFSPLINCIAHNAVLKFSPCRNKTFPQLVRIGDWYSINAFLQHASDTVIYLVRVRVTQHSSCHTSQTVLFRATNANRQPALFRDTNVWRNATYIQSDEKAVHFTR